MAASNVHQLDARARKAHTLAEFICRTELFDNVDLETLSVLPDAGWALIAQLADVNPPSMETVEAIVGKVARTRQAAARLDEHARRHPADPFSGLPS